VPHPLGRNDSPTGFTRLAAPHKEKERSERAKESENEEKERRERERERNGAEEIRTSH